MIQEAVDKIIEQLKPFGEQYPQQLGIHIDALHLGPQPDNGTLRVEIKRGAENGWLYAPYNLIVFDLKLDRPEASGSKRYYVNLNSLRELAQRELAAKVFSPLPKLNHLCKYGDIIDGFISMEKVIAL